MAASLGMVIDGIAASEAIDSSGEVLDVAGCDISELEEGRGVLNWEHRGDDAPGASPNDVVGRILSAKKIFKESDCDNERQRKYWRQIEMPFIYIVGRLFNADPEHTGARSLAAIIRDYKASGDPILVRYSIEGSTLEKKGNRLISSVARRVACTIKPCNRTCGSDVIDDPTALDGSKNKRKKDILDFDNADKSESSNPMYSTITSYEVECDPEVVGEDLDKALTAGMPSAAPSALVGGAALQVADGPGRQKAMVNQAMAAMRDFGKVNKFNRLAFKGFVKSRLPEASDDFIDHFADLAEDYQVKRQQLAKKESAEPKVKPKAPAKATAKPAAKAPAKKKAIEVNEDEADQAVVAIPNGTIRGIPTQVNKMRGHKFDETTGVLHTPKGSFPLYNPDKGFGVKEHPAAKQPFYANGVLHVAPGTDMKKVPANLPNPGFREIYQSKPIEEFHSGKVMPNWTRVHELTKNGKLPEEVIMHSAVFSMLSPNTPVRVHELMHAHMTDTWEDLGVDPRDADFKKARKHWLGKDQGTNYPENSKEYFQTHKDVHLANDSEGKGRKAGELMSFMLAENKFKNIAEYHRLHSTLVDMVKRHGTDARAATAELMELKHKEQLWKNARYNTKAKIKNKAATELGLKNHRSDYINRRMKELEAATPSSKWHDDKTKVRKAVNQEADKLGLKDDLSEHADAQIANHPQYSRYNGVSIPGLAPKTGRFTFTMLGGSNSFVPDTHIIRHLFGMDANKDSDTLAYLKSVLWNANNHHLLEGIDRWYAKNHPAALIMQQHPQWGQYFKNPEDATFPAFWRHWCSVYQDEVARGMPNPMAANEFSTHEPFWTGLKPVLDKMTKSELDHSMQAKMLALHAQYEMDHGEVPAQMMYFTHIVPHLLEAAEYRQRHNEPQDFIKSLRLNALDIELRKAVSEIQSADIGNKAVPTVHKVSMVYDGKEHPAGRFMVMGGNIHHLEDYHGLLQRLLPEGPVNMKTVSKIHALKMSPDLKIERQEPEQDENEPAPVPVNVAATGLSPNIVMSPRPSVWDYHRAGMDKPHTLEVSRGAYLLDGNTLSYPEVSTIITNLRNGTATIRYKSPETGKLIQKMEAAFTSLMKAAPGNGNGADMDPATALMHIRQAVAAGHIPQEVERAMTRHIYEDKMTPGIGNKYATSEFMKAPKPGVYIQMDGNDFREINNLHGHEAGDQAIGAFGKAAREAMDEAVGRGAGKLFRNPDEQDLYRNGGDEFVAHVPSHEHAAKFARALSQKLQAMPAIGGTHKLSMSFGFGTDPRTADQALYMAKDQKNHPGTKNRKFGVGQVPNLAHSLVPGHEGPLPVHDPGVSALHATLKNPEPAAPAAPLSVPKAS